MIKANLVNHTHWDREWYFTTMDALVLSEQLFTEVLDELEKNKDANFCLDGQVSIVDEYVEIHPEAKLRIQKLVSEGRLFVGPWYTQTDALIPDTESIIRNLVIGINDTKQNYGKPMMIGYLPDTFGFNAQMPTLLHQVGIDNFIFWRGTNFKRQMNSLYFRWKGLSEEEVLAANFPFGYFTAQIDLESKRNLKQFVEKRFDPGVKFAVDHKDNEEVLMPSGIDQMNIIKNIHETVKNLNSLSDYSTEISTYPDFIDKLRKNKDNLPEYSGELRLPTYARVHRTIGSVRHQIKTDSFNLEQKILRRIEPLVVIAHNNGVQIGNGLLIKLWKKLLECQPHDTLGGSVSDNVAVDIKHRFKEANEIADGIENTIEKKMAEFLKLNDHDVLVFNTDPYSYKGTKEVSVVASTKNIKFNGLTNEYLVHSKHYPVRHHILMMTPRGKEFTDEPEYYELTFKGQIELPALGYKVIHFEESQNVSELIESKLSTKSFAELKFGEQVITFDNGELNYSNNSNKVTDFLQLVDSGNDGDTYDYSPLEDDPEKPLPFNNVSIKSVGDTNKLMIIHGAASLPKDLKSRVSNNPDYITMPYDLTLQFNDLGSIDAKLVVNNTVLSHRLRLKFNPKIQTNSAIAQIQNGFIETENKKIDDNWAEEFDEKPVNIYNFDKTVSISDSNKTFTFLGKGMKEYEFVDSSLYITLMSTTGQLGKPDIAWRPGRASGDTTNQGHIMMPTPLAEEKGLNEFKFAMKFENTSFSEDSVSRLTFNWLNQSISYQMQKLNLFINRLDNKIWETDDDPQIPAEYSLLSLNDKYLVSAVYPSYSDSKSFIIRLQNPTKNEIKIAKDDFKDDQIVNALEEPLNNVNSIKPYDLISIKCKFKN